MIALSLPSTNKRKAAYSLLEVLVSVAVSSTILGVLFYLLSLTLDQWTSQTDGQVNSAEARSALTYLEEDLSAIVIKNRGEAEWLRVQHLQISDIGTMPWLTFLTKPTDTDKAAIGDVCAVSYRIEKRSAFSGHEPVHGLYRMILSPEETAEFVGTTDLNTDYWQSRESEAVSLDRFLAGYVIGFDLLFHLRDPEGNIHILESNREIRAAQKVTDGSGLEVISGVPKGSIIASVEIRLTVIDRGAQHILNANSMTLDEITSRYGRIYLSVVEFPEPSF